MSIEKYVAFLRGINVGGHHRVPMADLRDEMKKLKFQNVETILNSGNIVFDVKKGKLDDLESKIMTHLEEAFGFPIPTMLRRAETIIALLEHDPFKDSELTKDIRFYVSFLRDDSDIDIKFPWVSEDASYTILSKRDKMIASVLDIGVSKTPKAMEILEKFYKKDITTRNWNTIKRLEKKIY